MWYLYLSDTPFSHFETVCLTTFSLVASSSCVIPFLLRSAFKLSWNIVNSSFALSLYCRKLRCFKQRKLTSPAFAFLRDYFTMHFGIFLSLSQKKSLQKSPSGTISILVTPRVRLIVRMRMRKIRFNRNAISIFYGCLVFCFFPITMPCKRRQARESFW